MRKKIILVFLLLSNLFAESLQQTINEILNTNPVILERLKNYNATKEDITTAKSGYYPKVDLIIGAGQENTEREIYSTNYTIYENSLKYTHNLFNGFSTTYLVKEQEYRTLAAAYNYIEKVNMTAFDMVNVYLELMKNQELLGTAVENVKIDEEILGKVKKLYSSGLTTLSEVNKVESSLALARSNLVVQENSILDASYNLQKVLGRSLDPKKMQIPHLNNINFPKTREDAIRFAIKNNPSILVSDYNIKLAQAAYKEKQSLFYPKLDIEVSQALNNNVGAIKGKDDVFRAVAYISYNLFNGFNDKATIQKNISKIHQEVENKNTIRRDIIQTLSLSWAARKKLNEQLIYLIEYKDFSNKTLALYAKEYDLGRRSLLDLLSAQNDFIRAKAQIIDTKYKILYAEYRILNSMGILVQSVMKNTKFIYQNVGLHGKEANQQDTLPIYYDRDKDLIPNDLDICDNSFPSDMKNLDGCKMFDKNILQIERYNSFLFNDKKLTKDAKYKIKQLIKQLKPYSLDKIKFDILGNAQKSNLTENELYKLSKYRAQKIANILIKTGVNPQNINIIANGDKAPMYSSDNSKQNNRVDIIVKKLKH